MKDITEDVLELVRLCATELPEDVKQGLVDARDKEEEGSMAYNTFASILENVDVAKDEKFPMCQDTGAPILGELQFISALPEGHRGADNRGNPQGLQDPLSEAERRGFPERQELGG